MFQFALLVGLLAGPPITSGAGEVIVIVEPADAVVELDGRSITAGEPVRVQAGTHQIRVTRAGHRPHERQFVLDAGGRARFEVTLRAGQSAAAPTPARQPPPWVTPGQSSGVVTHTPRSSTALRPLGTAFFITALVTGVASGIVAIIAHVKASRFREERSYARKIEAREDVESLATATQILVAVTGAFAGAGVVMFAIDGAGRRRAGIGGGLSGGGIGYRGTF